MSLAPTLHSLTIFGYVSVSLLLPVAVSTQRSFSSIHIDKRHINNNEVEVTSTLESINNITDDTPDPREVTSTASEKFLESLREKCKKYKSISLICGSLRLVVPITPPQPAPLFAPSDPNTNPEDADKKGLLKSMNFQKRFTEPSNFTEIETHIVSPEQHDETTALPSGYHFGYYHNHREVAAVTDKDTEYDVMPKGTDAESGAHHMFYGNSYREPNFVRNKMAVDSSESNPFTNPDESEKTVYSEIVEKNMEKETNSQEKDTSSNVTYKDKSTDISEDDILRTTDTASQIGSLAFVEEPQFETPYTDINLDYDDKESEQGESSEMEEGNETNQVHGHRHELECSEGEICAAGATNTQNGSENTGTEEDDGKSELLDRFIDNSFKLFKNSLTIKFPTLGRFTNKISEWVRSAFGTKSRDEGKNDIKVDLNLYQNYPTAESSFQSISI
jgi:hypothetical protein